MVLGCDSGKERFRDAATLLDYGFANFESRELKLNEELEPITVDGGMQEKVDLICEESAYLTVPKGEGEEVQEVLDLPERIQAPVCEGDPVGRLAFMLNEDEIASFGIVAGESVEEKSFSSVLALLWSAMISS